MKSSGNHKTGPFDIINSTVIISSVSKADDDRLTAESIP